MMWKYHVDNSTKGRYDMILGRYLLVALVLNLKFYDHIIVGGKEPDEGCSAPMVEVSNNDYAPSTDKNR